MAKLNNWSCPSCNATTDSKVSECCDYCLLTLFDGKHSPDLATAFAKYNSIADWTNDKTDYSEN